MRPVPLLKTLSRLLAIRATDDTSAQKAQEEADEDDKPTNTHVEPHIPSPWSYCVRIGTDVASPSTEARLRVLSCRRREQQRAGVSGDHQILIGRDHPHRADASRHRDDLRMRGILLWVEVDAQVR